MGLPWNFPHMLGTSKYTCEKSFTSLNLSVQEFSRDLGPKWAFRQYKFFFTIFQRIQSGIVLFKRELFSAWTEGKGFFKFFFVQFWSGQNPPKSQNPPWRFLENLGFLEDWRLTKKSLSLISSTMHVSIH